VTRPRRSYSRIGRCARFLVAGFLINIVIAWILAYSVPMTSSEPSVLVVSDAWYSRREGTHALFARSFTAAGSQRRVWECMDWRTESPAVDARLGVVSVPGEAALPLVGAWSPLGGREWGRLDEDCRRLREGYDVAAGMDTAHGWPALTLWYSCEGVDLYLDTLIMAYGRGLIIHGGIPLPPSGGGATGPTSVATPATVRALPLRPVWSGMIINTLFYGALGMACTFLAERCRRVHRFQGGRCPVCDYDLCHDFVSGCSECGWRKL